MSGPGVPSTGERALRSVAMFAGYWWHLRHPDSIADARRILSVRLTRRETDFLQLARAAIFRRPRSVYRQLLRQAGCEYGDLETLLRCEGLEGGLQVLLRRGVYISIAELKGRTPIRRGSTAIETAPGWMRNPFWRVPSENWEVYAWHRKLTPVYLALFRGMAVNSALVWDARGAAKWRQGYWGSAIGMPYALLSRLQTGGNPVERWFLQSDPDGSGLGIEGRLLHRLIRATSLAAGLPFPAAEIAALDRPGPVLNWLCAVLRDGDVPCLTAYSGPVALLCQAAEREGIRLDGARIVVSGAPLTAGLGRAIARVGALPLPLYASKETALLADACLYPVEIDEMHLFSDRHSIIQSGVDGLDGMPSDALLVTSLRASWPLVLLNVSLGDRAIVSRRRCGCPLETLGWQTHVHGVRSFEKLTIAIATDPADRLTDILERRLPALFGGGPLDYQFVEESDEHGLPSGCLTVSPTLGQVDLQAVRAQFVRLLLQAQPEVVVKRPGLGWLRVERRAPVLARGGKLVSVVPLGSRMA